MPRTKEEKSTLWTFILFMLVFGLWLMYQAQEMDKRILELEQLMNYYAEQDYISGREAAEKGE